MRTVTDQAAHPRHDQQILSFFTSVSPAERPDRDPPDARVSLMNPGPENLQPALYQRQTPRSTR